MCKRSEECLNEDVKVMGGVFLCDLPFSPGNKIEKTMVFHKVIHTVFTLNCYIISGSEKNV